MLVKDQPLLNANRHVIAARWFWLLGVALIGWIHKGDYALGYNLLESPVTVLFLSAVAINVLFTLLAAYVDKRGSVTGLNILSRLQVGSDIVLLALAMFVGGGSVGIVPVLFIIPILEAIVLFDVMGPLLFALISSLFIVVFAFIEDYTGKPYTATLALQTALSLSLLYVVIGLFAAYLSRLIKERTELLVREAAVKEQRVVDLEKLNKELEKKTNALAAKEMELSSANERLSTLEQAKSKFVSVTTHQLRTPLAAIKWTFSMLLEGTLGPITKEQRDFIEKGSISTQRIISIINDLLSIDHIDAKKSDYVFSEVELDELINSIIFEFTNQAESKHIRLQFKLPDHKLPRVEADPLKIRMVVENLIDNAIKYTPNHGQVTISLSDEKVNTASPVVEVTVGDSGAGIPLDDQKKIFGKFFRSSTAVKMEPDGTGLGLFITKDIVEKHGGTIWFESAINQGTKFHFTLPVHQKKV